MSFVATAIVGAGVLGATGAVIAGGEQASGQEKAAQTQQGMFNTIVGQEQPFLQGGYGAETALNQLLGTAPGTGVGGTAAGTNLPAGFLTQTFNPTQAQLENYPGYQFELGQGEQAIKNQLGPAQSALSGATLKSLTNYAEGLASSDYSNYFNQFQTQQNNIFSRLSQIASLGQNAAGNLGSAGTQLGTGIAGAQAGAAASTAGGIVGATNSISGASIPLAYLMANQPSALGGASAATGAGLPSQASMAAMGGF